MTAVAITVGIVGLLYILVVQWSFQRQLMPLVQYRARIWGSIFLVLLMGLMVCCADMVSQPSVMGSPFTAMLSFGGYVLVMCLLLIGMVACALIDLRESLKNYVEAQRELLRGGKDIKVKKPNE